MISKAQEEYLKTMYVLNIKNKEIRVTDIAIQMNCSKASVTKTINNLKEEGLVNYETYGKIELTEKGIDLSKKILEAYDIIYVFLKDNDRVAKNTSWKRKQLNIIMVYSQHVKSPKREFKKKERENNSKQL